MVGLVFQFIARLIDYDNNPLSFYYPPLAILAGISAAMIVLWGYFTITRGKARQETMTKRKGTLLIIFGATMLAGFFLFKETMPMIFG